MREVSSDYGTMSQGGATVPPLNFEDDVSIHLAGSRAGSRFRYSCLSHDTRQVTAIQSIFCCVLCFSLCYDRDAYQNLPGALEVPLGEKAF